MIEVFNRRTARGVLRSTNGRMGTRRMLLDIDALLSTDRVHQTAMREEERMRLACDLHDGVLQVLTGARLKLKSASRMMATNPGAARGEIEAVCDLMAAEQRELRLLLQALHPTGVRRPSSISHLAAELDALRERTERLSTLQVELAIVGGGAIPRVTGHAVFRIVQEALTNVARHACAQKARVTVTIQTRQVQINVADDGCGFPIRGRYNLAALAERNQGPRSLRERVASAGGSLILTSSPSGSTLEIALPLQDPVRVRSALTPRAQPVPGSL